MKSSTIRPLCAPTSMQMLFGLSTLAITFDSSASVKDGRLPVRATQSGRAQDSAPDSINRSFAHCNENGLLVVFIDSSVRSDFAMFYCSSR